MRTRTDWAGTAYFEGPAANWMADLNVRLDKATVEALAEGSEEPWLLKRSSRWRVWWLGLIGIAGGISAATVTAAALTLPTISALALAFAAATAVSTLLHVSRRIFGPQMRRTSGIFAAWGALFALVPLPASELHGTLAISLFNIAGGAAVSYFFSRLAGPDPVFNPLWRRYCAVIGGLSAACGPVGYWASPTLGIAGAAAFAALPTALLFGLLLTIFSHEFSAVGGLRQLATIYMHNDETAPKAIRLLDLAIERKRFAPDLYSLRGAIRGSIGDLAGANDDHIKVGTLIGGSAVPIMNRGISCLRAGDLARAEEYIRRACEIDPKLALAHCNLGVVLSKQGRYEEADAAYAQAIACQPNYPRAYCNRAFERVSAGRFDDAIADSNEAIRQRPDLAMAYVHRGLAYAGLGRTDEAAADYQRAIDLRSDTKAAKEAREALEALGNGPNEPLKQGGGA